MHGARPALRERIAHRVVVLDGGTATSLEAAGHDLRDELWSARMLLDDPAAVVAVHRAFLDAGAEVVTTASYQLAERSLAATGRDPRSAPRLLTDSVTLARQAVADHLDARASAAGPHHGPEPLVAASVGPYGAVLADGSEYRGGYGRSVDDLIAFHAPRVAALVAAGADVLACETIPSADELVALARVLDGCGVEVYVSVTLGPDGTTIPEGEPLLVALAPVLALGEVVAVGVNCCPAALVAPAMALLGGAGVALVAKPNAGARWDAAARRWVPRAGAAPAIDPVGWVEAGARLVGGCCGTSPDDLRALVATLGAGRG